MNKNMENKETMEELVRDLTSVVPMSKSEARGRINNQLSSLLQEILEKKFDVNAPNFIGEVVSVEDIQAIAKEWGIDI